MVGLPNVEKLVKREKHPRADELKLLGKDWLSATTDNGVIYRANVPKCWKEIMLIVMQYISVDDQTTIQYGIHLAFLNLLMGNKSFNGPFFIYHSLENTCLEVQNGIREYCNHQGLMLILFKHARANKNLYWTDIQEELVVKHFLTQIVEGEIETNRVALVNVYMEEVRDPSGLKKIENVVALI